MQRWIGGFFGAANLPTASVAVLGLVPLLFSTGNGSEVAAALTAIVGGELVTSIVLARPIQIVCSSYRGGSSRTTTCEPVN